jgi:hypothetical protein
MYQLKSFIQKAFLNEKDIKKITLNFSSGEKSFVVKRFYEFYQISKTNFENTSHCKKNTSL